MSFKRRKGLFELLIKNVKIIGENEITDGFVRTANGKITEVGKAAREAENEEVIDGNGKYLSPGFIDLHVHGGGGYSAMGSPEDIVKNGNGSFELRHYIHIADNACRAYCSA